MTLDETVRQKDHQRARLLEALVACTQEMLSSADKTDATEYVRLQMNLQSFSEVYKTLTGREYRVSGLDDALL